MSEENEEPGAELPPAPVYPDSFVPAGPPANKCLIMCRDPRIAYGWKKPRCPWCGGKTHLYDAGQDWHEAARERGEHLAAAVIGALAYPFRRRKAAEEVEFCEHCTDEIGAVCDDRGCLWDIFQATQEAVSDARKRA